MAYALLGDVLCFAFINYYIRSYGLCLKTCEARGFALFLFQGLSTLWTSLITKTVLTDVFLRPAAASRDAPRRLRR